MPYAPTGRDSTLADLTRGLGWFSIAIGVSEIVAPRRISRELGMRHPELFRAFGLREIAAGTGILAGKDPKIGLWGRVAGDLLDLAAILPSLRRPGRARRNGAAALALVAAAMAADLYAATCLTAQPKRRIAQHDYSDRSGFPSRDRAAAAVE